MNTAETLSICSKEGQRAAILSFETKDVKVVKMYGVYLLPVGNMALTQRNSRDCNEKILIGL